jgi:uncharacterized protein (TIGR02246 family)
MTLAGRARGWLPLMASLALLVPVVASAQIEQPRVPVRTALDEIRVLRAAYAEAFNKQDAAALAAMYEPTAIAIRADGTVLKGKDAILRSFQEGQWGRMSITSDTVRVFGNTAYDVGRVRSSSDGGDEEVSHYLVVLRRGINTWKISSVAAVPERSGAKDKDDAK